jgi:hypothetical protein
VEGWVREERMSDLLEPGTGLLARQWESVCLNLDYFFPEEEGSIFQAPIYLTTQCYNRGNQYINLHCYKNLKFSFGLMPYLTSLSLSLIFIFIL